MADEHGGIPFGGYSFPFGREGVGRLLGILGGTTDARFADSSDEITPLIHTAVEKLLEGLHGTFEATEVATDIPLCIEAFLAASGPMAMVLADLVALLRSKSEAFEHAADNRTLALAIADQLYAAIEMHKRGDAPAHW
jgi:hypothetical protein